MKKTVVLLVLLLLLLAGCAGMKKANEFYDQKNYSEKGFEEAVSKVSDSLRPILLEYGSHTVQVLRKIFEIQNLCRETGEHSFDEFL